MKFYIVPLTTILFFTMSIDTHAQTYTTESGYAEFKAKAPLNAYKGKSNELEGKINLEQATMSFELSAKSIKTGIGKRDRDMYKLLEIDQYPLVKFEGKIVSEFNADSQAQQQVTVIGDFTLHGVTRRLNIEGSLQKTSEGLKVEASWPVMISDYKMERPNILFYKVKDKHVISINATLTQ